MLLRHGFANRALNLLQPMVYGRIPVHLLKDADQDDIALLPPRAGARRLKRSR